MILGSPFAARFLCLRSSAGQALVEGVVVMATLLLLWLMSGWLFRLQDLALQATNASRYAAFDMARLAHGNRAQFATSPDIYFSGKGQQWRDLRARSWLRGDQAVKLSGALGTPLPELAQPGGTDNLAVTLRSQWSLADTGVREAAVTVAPQTGMANQPGRIQRRAFIVVNTGYAGNDEQVVRRAGASDLAWAQPEQSSRNIGQALASRLQPLDAPWSRPEPSFNWLAPWQHEVPSRHLQPQSTFFDPAMAPHSVKGETP